MGKKSSDHGGQFAFGENAVSTVTLDAPRAPLPAGAEHVPDPAPGQLLVTGEPAPATFNEAWQQVFEPLDEEERRLGVTFRKPESEQKYSLLRDAGVEDKKLSVNRTIVETDDIGEVLAIYGSNGSGNTSCSHYYDDEEVDVQACESLRCGCSHCINENASHLPGFISITDSLHSASYSEIRLRLPAGSAQRAETVGAAAEELEDLILLRQKATKAPWRILEPVPVGDIKDSDDVREAQATVEAAEVPLKKYAGIDMRGQVGYYDEVEEGSLAAELQHINKSLQDYRMNTTGKRGKGAKESMDSYKRLYEKGYHKHETVLKEIAEVETKLGAQLPESIREPALKKSEMWHRVYVGAVIKGRARAQEIVDGHQSAQDTEKTARANLKDLLDRRKELATWGAGWPEGAYDAPTEEEWAEIKGEPLPAWGAPPAWG